MYSSRDRNNTSSVNDNSEPSDIGNFLKQVRLDKGLTQLELANIIGISPKTISKWENNNGFPDQLYQMPLCKALSITLEELHSGRINTALRNKEKKETRMKYFLVFFIGILFIVIIILFSLLIYYKDFYNPLSLYYIDVTNDDQTVCNIDGYYIKDRNINMLYIGNIKLLLEDYNESDLVEISFIYKDETIFYTNDTKNISVNLDRNIDPNDIKIKVNINNSKSGSKSKSQEFNIAISTNETVENNIQYTINDDLFIKDLIKMGFKKMDNDSYKMETKDGSYTYDNISKLFLIDTFGNNQFTIIYNLSSNVITVTLAFRISNSTVTTEKYTYDINLAKLENSVGNGYSLNTVLKLLEPYITLHNRYLASTN